MSHKITIIRLTEVRYMRSMSHAKRLHAQGTHDWDGPRTLREVRDARQALALRDLVFDCEYPQQGPATDPDFNYPIPFNYPIGDQRTHGIDRGCYS